MDPRLPHAAAKYSLSVGWSWCTPPCTSKTLRQIYQTSHDLDEVLGPLLGRRHHAKQPRRQTPQRRRPTRASPSTQSPHAVLLLGERCRTSNPLAIRNRRRTPGVPPGAPPQLLRRARRRVRPSLRGSTRPRRRSTRPRRGRAGGARQRRRGSSGSATSIGNRTVLGDACERSSPIPVYSGPLIRHFPAPRLTTLYRTPSMSTAKPVRAGSLPEFSV